jgi:hypothetical protein
MLRLCDIIHGRNARRGADLEALDRDWRRAMFELFLVACVDTHICEYVQVSDLYATEETCKMQAAIIAGVIQGRHDVSGNVSYRFNCNLQESADAAPPKLVISPAPG